MVRRRTGRRPRLQHFKPKRRRRPAMTRSVNLRASAVVLVFGESLNDAQSVASLIEAHCPSLKGRVRARPRPTSLQKEASKPKTANWMRQLRIVIESYREHVQCVFIHRDADGPDMLGELAEKTEAELLRAGIRNAHAVVPVEEIEAWWLLFGPFTEKLRKSWAGTLSSSARDFDRISDPKEELVRLTRGNNPKKSYTEADSREVARHVAEAIEAEESPRGRSRSYHRFTKSVAECCQRSTPN